VKWLDPPAVARWIAALALALIVALSRRRTLRLPSAAPQAKTVGSAVTAGGSGFGRDDAG